MAEHGSTLGCPGRGKTSSLERDVNSFVGSGKMAKWNGRGSEEMMSTKAEWFGMCTPSQGMSSSQSPVQSRHQER